MDWHLFSLCLPLFHSKFQRLEQKTRAARRGQAESSIAATKANFVGSHPGFPTPGPLGGHCTSRYFLPAPVSQPFPPFHSNRFPHSLWRRRLSSRVAPPPPSSARSDVLDNGFAPRSSCAAFDFLTARVTKDLREHFSPVVSLSQASLVEIAVPD